MMASRPARPKTALWLSLSSSLLLHLAVIITGLLTVSLPTFRSSSRVLAVRSAFAPVGEPATADVVSSRAVESAADVTGPMIERQLDSLVQRLEVVPPDGNLDRLDRIASRLDRVASRESLEEVADHFQRWLGYQPRAAVPVEEASSAEFDFETAQLHDVFRESGADGQLKYSAELLDAAGRTQRVEMTPAEGKLAFELMQRIKASPLLDQVYRQIAMPLLDRFIQAARAVEFRDAKSEAPDSTVEGPE